MDDLTHARLNAGLSVSDACAVLGRSLRTWQHWKQHGAPMWALRVLALYGGDLSPLGWSGWTLKPNRLFAPDLHYGWTREQLYAEWWSRQRLALFERRQRDTREPDPASRPSRYAVATRALTQDQNR